MLEQSIAKAPASPRENKTPDRAGASRIHFGKASHPRCSPVGNTPWAASAVTKKMRLGPEAGNHRGSGTEKITGIDSRKTGANPACAISAAHRREALGQGR